MKEITIITTTIIKIKLNAWEAKKKADGPFLLSVLFFPRSRTPFFLAFLSTPVFSKLRAFRAFSPRVHIWVSVINIEKTSPALTLSWLISGHFCIPKPPPLPPPLLNPFLDVPFELFRKERIWGRKRDGESMGEERKRGAGGNGKRGERILWIRALFVAQENEHCGPVRLVPLKPGTASLFFAPFSSLSLSFFLSLHIHTNTLTLSDISEAGPAGPSLGSHQAFPLLSSTTAATFQWAPWRRARSVQETISWRVLKRALAHERDNEISSRNAPLYTEVKKLRTSKTRTSTLEKRHKRKKLYFCDHIANLNYDTFTCAFEM